MTTTSVQNAYLHPEGDPMTPPSPQPALGEEPEYIIYGMTTTPSPQTTTAQPALEAAIKAGQKRHHESGGLISEGIIAAIAAYETAKENEK